MYERYIRKMLIKLYGLAPILVSLLAIFCQVVSVDAASTSHAGVSHSLNQPGLNVNTDKEEFQHDDSLDLAILDMLQSLDSEQTEADDTFGVNSVRRKRLARFQSECMTDLDCPAGTCCIPTVGRNRVRECRRLRAVDELCHPHSKPTPFSGFRGFPLCPCTGVLQCNRQSWKCEIDLK